MRSLLLYRSFSLLMLQTVAVARAAASRPLPGVLHGIPTAIARQLLGRCLRVTMVYSSFRHGPSVSNYKCHDNRANPFPLLQVRLHILTPHLWMVSLFP